MTGPNSNETAPTNRESAAVSSGSSGKLSIQRLVPLLLLVAGLAAFFLFGLDRYVSLDALKENRDALNGWVARQGIVAGLVFMAIYAVVTAFSIPGGLVMTITAGFLFGPYLATVYVVIGATIGATLLFLAARYAFADFFREKAGGAVRKMKDGFNENPLSYLLILRLVPLFPFWLVNLVPGLLGVKVGIFVLGTFFGIIPGTFVYSLVGDGAGAVLDAGGDLNLGIIFEPRFLAPIVGLAVLASLPIAYRKLKARRSA